MALPIKKNVPLSQYTTLGVGGPAEYFVEVSSDAELEEAVAFAQSGSLHIHVLAGGSNLLASDEGVKGLVIRMMTKGMSHIHDDDAVFLTVQAGEVLDDVVAHCVSKGWWGIENLSHIPGTIGATPVQNVGAYGVEVKDVIETVRVFNTQSKQFEVLDNAACSFSYRDSIFKSEQGKKYIVTDVTIVLSEKPRPQITYKDLALYFKDTEPSLPLVREAVMKIRAEKFPNWHEIGTAGSFFKNPIITSEVFEDLQRTYPELPGFSTGDGRIKISLGWVLDKVLHLRGYTSGNVATYKNQALVLIADKNATSEEIKMFADDIVEKIKNAIGVSVEWEVTKLK